MSDNHWELIDGEWLYGGKKLTAIKAIHKHCSTECQLSAQQARKCENRECRFWGFREGHNPNVNSTLTQQIKDASGKYIPVNTVGKSILQDIGDGYTVPDGYEVIVRRKHKEK